MIAKTELTWRRLLPVWWALTWRVLLFGTIAGSVLGFAVGVALMAAGAPQMTTPMATAIGLILHPIIMLWALREALTRRFKAVELSLVSSAAAHFE